ncbi:hypothetical protein IMCC3317_10890 [Kordia antarctica]|uniref:Uncharacterized protein n=1 Tax=Kordia antarctica TaxID=1218801 RepID=A0A7L4ZH14_9FLAO|nr:hypothetical protein [Kordia antarctica]QHI35741.1 hypothetical protein IMCC3317_10890 [Kordia antarctica]
MIKQEDIQTMGKVELRRMLFGISRKEARIVMNTVIADCRKISEVEAKKRKLILRHEVLKVLDFFGFEVE